MIHHVALPLEIVAARDVPLTGVGPAGTSARGPAARRWEVSGQVRGLALSLTLWIDVLPGEPSPRVGAAAELALAQDPASGALGCRLLLRHADDAAGAPPAGAPS